VRTNPQEQRYSGKDGATASAAERLERSPGGRTSTCAGVHCTLALNSIEQLPLMLDGVTGEAAEAGGRPGGLGDWPPPTKTKERRYAYAHARARAGPEN